MFAYYFEQYEAWQRCPHPFLKAEQIQRIIEAMPYIDSDTYGFENDQIDSDAYPAMIDKHFETEYRDCDYNINHFFSGDIRALRYYEVHYRE